MWEPDVYEGACSSTAESQSAIEHSGALCLVGAVHAESACEALAVLKRTEQGAACKVALLHETGPDLQCRLTGVFSTSWAVCATGAALQSI